MSEEGVGYSKIKKLLSTGTSRYNTLYDFIKEHYSDVVRFDDDIEKVEVILKVCITGKLSQSRGDYEASLRTRGVVSTHIKDAKVLISNDLFSNSSKARYAREKGIPIMDEQEFSKYLDSIVKESD